MGVPGQRLPVLGRDVPGDPRDGGDLSTAARLRGQVRLRGRGLRGVARRTQRARRAARVAPGAPRRARNRRPPARRWQRRCHHRRAGGAVGARSPDHRLGPALGRPVQDGHPRARLTGHARRRRARLRRHRAAGRARRPARQRGAVESRRVDRSRGGVGNGVVHDRSRAASARPLRRGRAADAARRLGPRRGGARRRRGRRRPRGRALGTVDRRVPLPRDLRLAGRVHRLRLAAEERADLDGHDLCLREPDRRRAPRLGCAGRGDHRHRRARRPP